MNREFRVLVVDDERLNRITTAQQLEKRGFRAEPFPSAYAAIKALGEERWDVVLTDVRMSGMDGLELLDQVVQQWPGVDVILMTAHATVETAVRAMKAGAADYLVKPFQIEELEHRLRRLRELRDTRAELESLRRILGSDECTGGMIGRSAPMLDVYRRIEMFADHRAPVLITGPTGTGKELVARALHEQSGRSGGPFVPIGCGTIPNELAESELFGHEKGSFTGALKLHKGSFERAEGGSLLLDDIDDLPLALQVKLLRVLQDGTLTRVGGTQQITVDVRVIATSKKDLGGLVEAGDFRDDLYYRLRGLEIDLPRLADRGEDLLLIAQHFLRTTAELEGRVPARISVAAALCLREHDWPGNVRELRRVMESADILASGEEILPEHLPACGSRSMATGCGRPFALNLEGLEEVSLGTLLEQFEESVIEWAMTKAGGQQKRAAELLGIPRTTLQSRIARVRTG